MTKQQTTRRPLIEYDVAKPFVDATALGVGCALFAAVSGGPTQSWAFLGGGFSLLWYWGSRNLTRPAPAKKQPGARRAANTVVVNGQKWAFDYQPGYVSRETWGETIKRLWGKKRPPPDDFKPPEPQEPVFIFCSRARDGQPFELEAGEVVKFLRTAHLYRDWGRGLSQRFWVRGWKRRPQWYQEMGGPVAYWAFLNLIREAQKLCRKQLVVKVGHQQYALRHNDIKTFEYLYEAEWAKKGRK